MDDAEPKREGRRGKAARKPAETVALHARRAAIQLRILASAVAREAGVGAGQASGLERVKLAIDLAPPNGRDADPLAEQLVAELRARLRAAHRAHLSFREGRVFCFQCDRPDCLHAELPGPTQTFAGYAPTGRPLWHELTTLCLAQHEPRVDRLFAETPEVLVLAQDGAALSDALLPSFGGDGKRYVVRGQVVAGLVPDTLDPTERRRDRLVLTLQVVETRSGAPGRLLQLNLLGLESERVAALAVGRDPRSGAERLRRTLQATRHRLCLASQRLEAQEARGEPLDIPSAVAPLLVALRGEVQRALQGRGARTAHAQERHLAGQRPTAQALQDALLAPDERFLGDDRRGTIVVVGPKNRAHVFAPDGRHVTSLSLAPGELDRRTAGRRWLPLPRPEAEAFRARVQHRVDARSKRDD